MTEKKEFMRQSNYRLIMRVLFTTRKYWGWMIFLFFLSLLAAPIALLRPYALKLLIDSGFGSEPVSPVIHYFFPADFSFSFGVIIIISAGLVIMVALVENIYSYLSWVWETYVGERLVLNFRAVVFDHIQRLSLAYHDTKGSSDSLYRIQWDTMCIRALLLSQLSPMISSTITLLAMISVMFMINWQFAIIAICLIPPLIFLTKVSTKKLNKDWYRVKEAESSALSVVHEVLSSLRVVKAFGQEDSEQERFNTRSNTVVDGQVKMAKIGATFSFIIGMLLACGTALFLYIGGGYVHTGAMTLGELTLVLAYLAQVFTPLQNIIKNLNELQSSLASLDRVFSVLDEDRGVRELPDARSLTRVSGQFEFAGVSFGYNEGIEILKQVSFAVKPGDRVGIMGSTGAGKSTLISLLNRFYDPIAGVIKVDGEDIRNFKLKDYRKQFSIVLQEPVLFSTTIGENIKYGKPGATDEEVIKAAIAANAHQFIIKSKDGYNTLVGERGMQISGGERQRISLARAFIKNAPVLIMDEPTSSLDGQTEALVMEAMERLMVGRTTFMISHRLDTLSSCNLILHIENGELIQIVHGDNTEFLKQKKERYLKRVQIS